MDGDEWRQVSVSRGVARRDTPRARNAKTAPGAVGGTSRGDSGGERSLWEDDSFFHGRFSDARSRDGFGGGDRGGGGGGDAFAFGGGRVRDAPLTLLEASARRVARHYEASNGKDVHGRGAS